MVTLVGWWQGEVESSSGPPTAVASWTKTLHTCSQKYRGMESYRKHRSSGSLRRAGTGGDTGRLVAGRSGKQQWLPYSGGILDKDKKNTSHLFSKVPRNGVLPNTLQQWLLEKGCTGGDTGRLVAGRSGKQQWLPYSGGIRDKDKKHFTFVLKSTEEWSLTEHTAAVAP